MSTDRRRQRRLGALSVVYLALVARLTLWPELAEADQLSALRTAVVWVADHGVPVTYAGLEAAANVAMFVPFGVLGVLLAGAGRRWAVVGVAAATSGAIETAQLLALPMRVASGQDIALNTLGAAIGVLAAGGWAAWRRSVHDRHDRGRAAPSEESATRPE